MGDDFACTTIAEATGFNIDDPEPVVCGAPA